MNDTPSSTAIFAPLWRGKWLILVVAIVAAAGTYLYYRHQHSVYRTETKLYLAGGAEEGVLEKSGSGKAAAASEQAQPTIINSIIVESVKRHLRKEGNRIAKLAAHGKVKATSGEKNAFVTIKAEARTPRSAALLANTIAKTYIERQHRRYERNLLNQEEVDERQLARIEATSLPVAGSKAKAGANSTSLIREAQLQSKINAIESELGAQEVQQLAPARPTKAILVEPRPKRNAEFAFVIGIVLAALAVFALARFDRRLRQLSDVEAVFHAQILAALPQVRQPIVRQDGYSRPSRFLLEPLRLLRTTLLLNGAPAAVGKPRTILFVSADSGDGRSTVVAGLALAQREAGERAVVVEADMRRPVQSGLLGLGAHSGLVDVLTRQLSREEALQRVPDPSLVVDPEIEAEGALAAAQERGAVFALPSAAAETLNPPALLSSVAMAELLRDLGEEYDHVLVDAPSPLQFSDAMALLTAVDGIVIVARVGHTRERSAERLHQMLAHTQSAPILGVVANGVSPRDIQRYGMSTGRIERSPLARLIGR